MKHDAIAVVDFGGQYAHLIATKVRKHNVLAEILEPDDPIGKFQKYKGVIISGSPALGSKGEESTYNKEIYDLPTPILGFCFGHQELALKYGGKTVYGGQEWGKTEFHITKPDHPLFDGLDRVEQVWMSHFDSVSELGPGFQEFGISKLGEGQDEHRFAALGSDKLKRYGFQFHPEVDDTPGGDRMIGNFVLRIAGCKPSWTMEGYIDEQVDAIRKEVGDGSVFMLASGGVDSTVAAKLVGLALGKDRLHLLHVDNGFMRKDESKGVIELFDAMGYKENLHFVDASETFLGNIEGETEPEKKRTCIGNTFIDVFQTEAKRLNIEDHLLGQGTIYPDTIETGGSKRSDTIKTHHNRVPLIEKMIREGKVIEPLRDLYKTEVRELGERLGIDKEACRRHPFPGPGLGVRLLCSDGESDRDMLHIAEKQIESKASEFNLEAMVLPIRSVGVKADVRSYEHPVMFSGEANWETLQEAAGAVLRDVSGINRCVWNLGPKTPKTSRTLPATVTRERLDLLREADHFTMEGLRRHGLYDSIWQCPTVLVPLEIDGEGTEFVVIRPIHSERAMTASAASLPKRLIDELVESIFSLQGISGLALDLTSKPPGTIEWE